MTENVYEYFFSIPFRAILDQISGEKQLKLLLAEFVYILAAVKFLQRDEQGRVKPHVHRGAKAGKGRGI
jgi:hypothetical protein